MAGIIQLGILKVDVFEKEHHLVCSNANLNKEDAYEEVRKFYNKVKRRSGKHVARTVVGKELAKIVWHMLTNQEEYKGFKGPMTKISTENYWTQPISSNA